EEAARDGLLADMTAETLQTLEQERNRAASSIAEMRAALDQANAEAELTAAQLENTTNQLAEAQQEVNNLVMDAETAIADNKRAIEERDGVAATAAELQAVLDGMEKKRGPLALGKRSAEDMGTTAAVVPSPLASHPFGPPT
ncbi:unnamed protein product, partial [Laminaria digitata]